MLLRPCQQASRLTCGCCSAQWAGWMGSNAPDYMVRVAVVATPTVTGHRRHRRCCTLRVANTWRATGRVSESERVWRCAVVVAVPTSPSTRQERAMLNFQDFPGNAEPYLSSSCKEYPGAKDRREAEELCKKMACVRHMAARSSPLATRLTDGIVWRRCEWIYQKECSGDWAICGQLSEIVQKRRAGGDKSCARYLSKPSGRGTVGGRLQLPGSWVSQARGQAGGFYG